MKTALTIGNFDGVHKGHRALVDVLRDWRSNQVEPDSIKTMAMTFEPHPREVLSGKPVERLCTSHERSQRLQRAGIDEVRLIAFSKEYATIPAIEFFEKHVVGSHNVAFIAVGYNFYFGHNREGTPEKILEWSKEKGIQAKLVKGIEADGETISSTRIRKLIASGHLPAASRLLGRDYSISGEVEQGDQRGRLLGFPTANLYPSSGKIGDLCMPATGVYLTTCTIVEEGRSFPSVTNVGFKPTIGENKPFCIESHVLGFQGNLYGKLITVEFKDRIRSEKKFDSLDALKLQIQEDIEIAKGRIV
ncbi:bifunctional riboflavin kinase/FAD synthetase [bacterium]|nr:bifunctional riboflavin kinase/FAD synthetase [bacterium]